MPRSSVAGRAAGVGVGCWVRADGAESIAAGQASCRHADGCGRVSRACQTARRIAGCLTLAAGGMTGGARARARCGVTRRAGAEALATVKDVTPEKDKNETPQNKVENNKPDGPSQKAQDVVVVVTGHAPDA